MRIYDISPALNDRTACWPGDTPYRFELACSKGRGDAVNVGAVTMSLHTGAHVDAPFHFDDDLPGIDEIPLEVYIGQATVVDATGEREISLERLPATIAPRVLLRTGAWPDRMLFPSTI